MRIQDKRVLDGMDKDATDELISNIYYRSANNIITSSNGGADEGVISNIKGNRNDNFVLDGSYFSVVLKFATKVDPLTGSLIPYYSSDSSFYFGSILFSGTGNPNGQSDDVFYMNNDYGPGGSSTAQIVTIDSFVDMFNGNSDVNTEYFASAVSNSKLMIKALNKGSSYNVATTLNFTPALTIKMKITTFDGTDSYVFGIESGINKCVGSLSVPELDTIFVFNWNENSGHSIYRISLIDNLSYDVQPVVFLSINTADITAFPVQTINGTELVTNPLNFQEDIYIHSISYVEGFLAWTDGYNEPMGFKVYEPVNKLYNIFDNPSLLDVLSIKEPSLSPPTITLGGTQLNGGIYDLEVENNTGFKGRSYQFAYKYRYNDGRETVFSPPSKLTQTHFSAETTEVYTSKIFIDINNKFSTGYDDISKIVLAYKNIPSGNWNVFLEKDFDQTELTNNGGEFLPISFNGNEGFVTLSVEQLLKPYDKVPIFADTLEVVKDRKIYGGITDGYDAENLDLKRVSIDANGVVIGGTSPSDGVYFGSNSRVPTQFSNRSLLFDSRYKTGIVWKDSYGRKSGVTSVLDWDTTERGLSFFNVESGSDSIKGKQSRPQLVFDVPGGLDIPEWATAMDVVVTKNLSHEGFIEWLSGSVFASRAISFPENEIEGVSDSIAIGFTYNGRLIYNNGIRYDSFTYLSAGNTTQDAGVSPTPPSLLFLTASNGDTIIDPEGNVSSDFYNKSDCPFVFGSPSGQGNNKIGLSFDGEDIYIGGYVGGPRPSSCTHSDTWGILNKGARPAYKYTEEVKISIENMRFNGVGYIFSEGDRVRIYGYFNGTPPLFEPGPLYGFNNSLIPPVYTGVFREIVKYKDGEDNTVDYIDLEITGQDANSDLIVRWDSKYKLGLKADNFIKIYTPAIESVEDIFYDFGYTYKIDNAHTSNRMFYSETTSQISGVQSNGDLRVYIEEGDAFIIEREMQSIIPSKSVTNSAATTNKYTVNASVFAMNANDRYYQDWDRGLGRPNIKLDSPVRKVITTSLTYGGKIIEDSNINNIDSFELSGNTKDLPNEYGAIRKLSMVDNVLVVNCENEAVSVYVEEKALKDVLGGDVLSLTDTVLNNDRKMAGGYGCDHPETVVQYKSLLYWYSQNKQAVVRYNTGNGNFAISDLGMKSYFMDKANSLKATDTIVLGGYNPLYNMYYLKFDDETVCFNEGEKPLWIGTVDFSPESFGYITNRMITLKDGMPWEHDTNEVRNNFYGFQYISNLTFVSNIEPSIRKIFNNVMLETDSDTWEVTSAKTKTQETHMDSFEDVNGEKWTNILCDENSEGGIFEGDLLSDSTIEISIENNSTEEVKLFKANVFSQKNERTNK